MRCKECGRSDVPAGAGWCCWCGKKIVKSRKKKMEIKVPDPKQLPSGKWNIYLRNEGQSVTEDSPEICKAKAVAIRAGFIEQSKTKSITLTKAIDKFIESKNNVISPSTLRGYRTIQRTRFQAYMDKDITKMNDNLWQAAVNQEALLVSPKTVKNSWLLISSVIVFAGLPKPKVSLPQAVPRATPFLEPDEIFRFIAAIKDTSIEIPCLLGLSSMRASEVHGLMWEDIDFEKRIIHVHRAMIRNENNEWIDKQTNKTASSTRNIPIMMDRLYEILLLNRKDSGKVVEMKPPQVSKRLPKACRDADVKEITFHGLRHSFASLAAHLGMPEAIAMQIGGWSNDKIMKRIYTHILETDVNRYQNEMSNYYNASSL